MSVQRISGFAASVAFALGCLSAGNAAADIFLQVNVDTGNVRIYGDAGDVMSRYEIRTSDSQINSFDRSLYTATRWGTHSVADGFGLWHAHGTLAGTPDAGLGITVTTQIGEMSAVYAGGQGANASRLLDFGALSSDALGHYLDLGDVFLPGSPQDLIFSYVDTMGYSFALSSGPRTYTINVSGSPYDGQTYVDVTPVTSDIGVYPLSRPGTHVSYVSSVPEPTPLALGAAGAVLLLLLRGRRAA